MMDLSVLETNYGYTPNSILDIGCNVGQFYGFAKNYWPNASYFLIDGNESVREDLTKLNVPFKIALLSDSEKEVIFYKNKSNPKCTGSSIYKETTHNYDDAIEEIRKTETLDSLFPDTRFDLIKLDTQGSEIDILNGAKNILQKLPPVFIIIETSLVEWNLNSPRENEVIEYMSYYGYVKPTIIGSHYLNGKLFQQDIIFVNPLARPITKLI